jgi:hypothetical protein
MSISEMHFNIGHNAIKELNQYRLDEVGISKQEWARRSGIDPTALSRILNRRWKKPRNPSEGVRLKSIAFETFCKLASGLGLRPVLDFEVIPVDSPEYCAYSDEAPPPPPSRAKRLAEAEAKRISPKKPKAKPKIKPRSELEIDYDDETMEIEITASTLDTETPISTPSLATLPKPVRTIQVRNAESPCVPPTVQEVYVDKTPQPVESSGWSRAKLAPVPVPEEEPEIPTAEEEGASNTLAAFMSNRGKKPLASLI